MNKFIRISLLILVIFLLLGFFYFIKFDNSSNIAFENSKYLNKTFENSKYSIKDGAVYFDFPVTCFEIGIGCKGGNAVIAGADAKSFSVFNKSLNLAKDKDNYYENGRKITNAKDLTYDLESIISLEVEGADALFTDGSKIYCSDIPIDIFNYKLRYGYLKLLSNQLHKVVKIENNYYSIGNKIYRISRHGGCQDVGYDVGDDIHIKWDQHDGSLIYTEDNIYVFNETNGILLPKNFLVYSYKRDKLWESYERLRDLQKNAIDYGFNILAIRIGLGLKKIEKEATSSYDTRFLRNYWDENYDPSVKDNLDKKTKDILDKSTN